MAAIVVRPAASFSSRSPLADQVTSRPGVHPTWLSIVSITRSSSLSIPFPHARIGVGALLEPERPREGAHADIDCGKIRCRHRCEHGDRQGHRAGLRQERREGHDRRAASRRGESRGEGTRRRCERRP